MYPKKKNLVVLQIFPAEMLKAARSASKSDRTRKPYQRRQ
jgi:hypothetical protein